MCALFLSALLHNYQHRPNSIAARARQTAIWTYSDHGEEWRECNWGVLA